jgi:hypothetical protein
MSGSELREAGRPGPGLRLPPAAGGGVRAALAGLFPVPDEPAPRAGLARWAFPLARVIAAALVIALGAAVMLARLGGRPAWDTAWAEDPAIYLPQALAHPWHLLQSYAGYLQLVPRLIGQAAALAPARDAAAVFAAGGAAVTAACGLFAYHASAGHVRSRWLRVLLGLSVLLLPVAQLEVADNGVDTIWYLLAALFWAALWRPRSRAGAASAAAVALAAAASSSLALFFAPLFLARALVVPRRPREHAATAGWALGCLLQAGVILTSHTSRLVVHDPVVVVRYYGYEVLLPALGWHLSWHLRDIAGETGAAVIAGAVIIAVLAVAAVRMPGRCRAFVVTAMAAGLVTTAVSALGWGGAVRVVTVAAEPAARYSTLPILLIDAALIVAADACAARWRPGPGSARFRSASLRSASFRSVVAVAAVTAVLAAGWATDFRYPVARTAGRAANWQLTAAAWLSRCEQDPAGAITVTFPDYWGTAPLLSTTFSCARLRR